MSTKRKQTERMLERFLRDSQSKRSRDVHSDPMENSDKGIFKAVYGVRSKTVLAHNSYRMLEQVEKAYDLCFAGEQNVMEVDCSHNSEFVLIENDPAIYLNLPRFTRTRQQSCKQRTAIRVSRIDINSPKPIPQVVQIYTGRVDVLDDEDFIVRLKATDGKPMQIAFPVDLAEEAGLAPGDFVRYKVLKTENGIGHRFEKKNRGVSRAKALEIRDKAIELLENKD